MMVESGEFINVKTGNRYTVLGIAVNATNKNDGETMILYALSETLQSPSRNLYVRECEEFVKKFKSVDV